MTRRISNSEVMTWLSCRRKYYYAFDLNIMPKLQRGALARGVIIHEALAEYYSAIMLGKSQEEARTQGVKVFTRRIQNDNWDMETVLQARTIFDNYAALYGSDSAWTILEVEQLHTIPLTPDYEYAMRLDVLARNNRTGHIVIWDHKSTYNFWSIDDIELNAQFPKYFAALRHGGTEVHHVMVNELRTRELKNPQSSDLFRRERELYPTPAKVRNALSEQIMASQEITNYRELPPDAREKRALRTMTPMTCKTCQFKKVCLIEYDGGTIDLMVATEYVKNSYDYNQTAATTAHILGE